MAKQRGQRPSTIRGQGEGRVFPGAGMGITRGYGVGTREAPSKPYTKSGRRVVGGVFPGEGMGLPVRGPTAPGRAARPQLNQAGSTRLSVRSPTPTSILNSGRSYYGPLSYTDQVVENRPYAVAYGKKGKMGFDFKGGMDKGNRSRSKRSPDRGEPRVKRGVSGGNPISRFTKEY